MHLHRYGGARDRYICLPPASAFDVYLSHTDCNTSTSLPVSITLNQLPAVARSTAAPISDTAADETTTFFRLSSRK